VLSLIVDDHAGFRHAARRLLEAAGFTMVGEAADAKSALIAAAALQPEVILVDVTCLMATASTSPTVVPWRYPPPRCLR
jgi:DNA-binding NarL/FixJ family response regulator